MMRKIKTTIMVILTQMTGLTKTSVISPVLNATLGSIFVMVMEIITIKMIILIIIIKKITIINNNNKNNILAITIIA